MNGARGGVYFMKAVLAPDNPIGRTRPKALGLTMRIQLLFLGKTRRPEIRALVEDYAARIRRYAEIEVRELRLESAASRKGLEIDGATGVLLDAAGKKVSSEQVAEWIKSCRDRGQRKLLCFCG